LILLDPNAPVAPVAQSRDANATGRRLARQFAPLAAASLLAALAGPVLNHTLALGARPTAALAGFWLGYSVLLLFEVACFVWQPTSLAFLEEPRARRRLSLLALATGAVTSALVWLAGQPAAAGFVFRVLVPTSPEAAAVAAGVLRALAPLPALVALRGVLAASVLRDGRGGAIPAGLLARLAVLAAWSTFFRAATGPEGACEALLAASAVELAVLALARSAPAPHAAHHRPPSATRVAAVAAPLAISALGWAALRPLLQAVLGRLEHADLAQARFGLVFAVFMTMCAPVWALRDLGVLAEGLGTPPRAVRAFAGRVAAAVTLAFAFVLFAAGPAGGVRAALGFTPATGAFPWLALLVLALAPPLVAARMPAQGALIARHRTAVFAWVPGLRLALTAALGFAAARALPGGDGAVLGASLLLFGEAFEVWAYRRAAAAAASIPADASEAPRAGEADCAPEVRAA
jgi:hypothetical protein